MRRYLLGSMVFLAATAVIFALVQPAAATSPVASFSNLRGTLKDIKSPKIEQPTWLKKQLAAQSTAPAGTKTNLDGRVFTYSVTTSGAVYASLAEFKTLANQTLNDARGWSRMETSFSEVATGGDFTLVLAQASMLPTFSSGCSADWSCNAGRYVIINQDRWTGATTAWNNAGGNLRDYQHMVVNHETGHWLGHGHVFCSGAGNAAPVMQQQSIDLQGCAFNPWPLASELWTSR